MGALEQAEDDQHLYVVLAFISGGMGASKASRHAGHSGLNSCQGSSGAGWSGCSSVGEGAQWPQAGSGVTFFCGAFERLQAEWRV